MSPTSLDGDMMLLLLYDQKLVFRARGSSLPQR